MNVTTTEQVASVSVNPVAVSVSVVENVVSVSSVDENVTVAVSEQVVTVAPQVVTVALSVTENVVAITVQEGGGILTETDPVFSTSPAASITNADITNLGNLSGVNTGDQDISEEALGVILDICYLKLDGSNDPITGNITINVNSTTALLVEQTGVKSNVLAVDTTNGRVGIGTVPTALFHIVGTPDTSATFVDLLGQTRIATQRIDDTLTDATIATDRYGLYLGLSTNPNASLSGKVSNGLVIQNVVPSANANDIGTLIGNTITVRHNGTGTAQVMYGFNMIAAKGASAGTVTSQIGGFFQTQNFGPGTVTTSIGLQNTITQTGVMGTVNGIKTLMQNLSGSSITGNLTFYSADLTNSTTISGTTYGYYVGDITGGTQTGGVYAFYNSDASAPSYLAGSLGIGIVATAKFHVAGNADIVQSIIKANVTQTANLTEWQNSSGTVLTKILAGGGIQIPNNTSFATATSAGSACPLFRLDSSNNLSIGASALVDTAGFACFGSFRVSVGSNEGFRVTPTDVVVNVAGVSTIDFTVKGDVSTQLLFVDASAETVLIGSTVAGALTIGAGTAGIDYILRFNGETNDGTITFMEDENRFNFGNSIAPSVDSTNDIGANTLFFRVAYIDKIQFPISSSATSAPFMETSGQSLVIDLNRTDDSNQRTLLIKNTGNGDPILSVQEGAGANTITFQHTGSIGKIDSTFGGIQIAKNLKIGEGGAGVDYTLTFDGETNDGVITYMEDEDRFDFDNAIGLGGKVTVYNNIATEGYGVPAIVDQVSLTAQTADITATNFTNAGTAGLYRISYSLQDTTADVTAGAVILTISYTDGAGATTTTDTQVLTALGRVSGTVFIQLASGNITYGVTHTGLFGTSAYALHMTAERLS